MATQTYHGKYETAWETLQEYYAFQKSQGENMEEVRAHNSPIEEELRILIEAGNGIPEAGDELTEQNSNDLEFSVGNYPNPFNPTTNIRFTIPERSQVSLVVYDMLGRKVATLVNKVLSAGEQAVRFDASHLSNGMYLYKLRAGGQEIVNKMTLIK